MNNNTAIIDPHSHLKNKILIKIDPKEISHCGEIPDHESANENIVSRLENHGWIAEINTSPWQDISGYDCSAELIYVQNLVVEITKEVANEMSPEVISTKQDAVKNLEKIRNSLEDVGCLTNSMSILIDQAIEELI